MSSKSFILTINNPNVEEELSALRRHCKYFIGQLERGESGTPHLQILYQHPTKVRPTAIKKLFERAHIEIARDPRACIKYCSKEETRIDGPWTHGDAPEDREKSNYQITVK